MEVDKRKVEVLKAIVDSYILSPVPVGSRKISKDFDLGISSATIRNEMSDLEDLGYLNKPHSSAGRIPSDSAYRFYVDELLQDFLLRDSHRSFDSHGFDGLGLGSEEFYRRVTEVLAKETNSLAYLMVPRKRDTGIRFLDLVKLENNLVLAVIVGNLGIIERSMFRVEGEIDEGELKMISDILSEHIVGKDFQSIYGLKIRLSGEMIKYQDLILKVVELASNVDNKISEADIYASGITNILHYEEYQNLEQAQEIMEYMVEKENLLRMVQALPPNEKLSIRIGSENEEQIMQQSSLISGIYHIGESNLGRLGIVGPVRMDYLRLAKKIQAFTEELSNQLGVRNKRGEE